VRLHILIDHSSLEVFGNDGQVVFTELIFPNDESLGLELFVDGGEVRLNSLELYHLRPAAFSLGPAEQQ
jgi:sucrose-6-phosphate hydrolase SacC (GH32 family)